MSSAGAAAPRRITGAPLRIGGAHQRGELLGLALRGHTCYASAVIIIGIDPGGRSGGAVALTSTGVVITTIRFGRSTLAEVADWFSAVAPAAAMMESVGPMPKQGVRSVWTFGHHTGAVEGICAALQVPLHKVAPTRWQAAYGLRRASSETTTRWKARLRERADQIGAESGPWHRELADAYLIAAYARRELTHVLV